MAACSTCAPELCLQWCSTSSIIWPFAVRILPHHTTVAHGWIAHPRSARVALTTAFAFSPIKSRGSWLTWRTWMTVALGASWTCCDYLKKKKQLRWSWMKCRHFNQKTLNVSSLSLQASTWRPGGAWVSSNTPTRTSLLSTQTWFSLKDKYGLWSNRATLL